MMIEIHDSILQAIKEWVEFSSSDNTIEQAVETLLTIGLEVTNE